MEVYGWKNTYNKILENIQKYSDTTVAAAVQRLSNIYDQHDVVYGTFSGGKDSAVTSVLMATVIQLRRKVRSGELSLEEYNRITQGKSTMETIQSDMPSPLMIMDPEMAYSMTAHAYERMMKQFCGKYEIGDLSWVSENKEENPGCYEKEEILKMSTEEIQELITGYGQEPLMQGFWMCFPIAWENMASESESRYWSFDDRVKERWTRPLPQGSYVWSQENFYTFPLQYGFPPTEDSNVTMGQSDQQLRTMFSKYIGEVYKGKKIAVLVAIRAHESFDRYTVLKMGNYETGFYGTQHKVRTHSPVMDMTNEDVYRFFSVFDFPINKAYERMYDAGIPLAKMRIGSLLNSHAGNSSSWLASLDPGTHAKVLGRIDNLDFHNSYGGKVSNSKYIQIPQDKPFNEGFPKKVQAEAIELLGLDFFVLD